MCRRYSLGVCVETQVRSQGEPQYEIAHLPRTQINPGEMAPVLVRQADGLSVGVFRWGLIPAWTGQQRVSSPCVNAPAETVATNQPLRVAFERRRCAIAADGFYLWKHVGPEKVLWKFQRADRRVFWMAGLWETWLDHRGGDPIDTFTLITTASNAVVAPVHNRMPAILVGDAAPIWLNPDAPRAHRLEVLRPAPDDLFTAQRLTPLSAERSHSSFHDDNECLATVG